jgi:hypothetical protein
MDPREFHVLASELITKNRASEIRTAISRAYYAAHNVGAQILSEMGFRISKGSACHSDVWSRLRNSSDIQLSKVGIQLAELHSKRILADYRMNRNEGENRVTAQTLVRAAGQMIRMLDECRSEPRRHQIIEAIREWEIKTGQSS